jgi:hypothetical protein
MARLDIVGIRGRAEFFRRFVLTLVPAAVALSISPTVSAQGAVPSEIFFESAQLSVAKNNELRTRRLITKGQDLTVFYDSCVITGEIKFSETERNSRIHDDIVLLAKRLAGPTEDAGCGPTSKSYRLKYDRSIVTVSATDLNGKELGTKSLVVGPTERLSLGIDLPVGNRKTLQYDEASQRLIPKNSSNQLYLSLNVSSGDVLTKPQDLHWTERFDFKVLIKASSHPLDAYGVGIGYKLPPLAKINLQGLSIFAGYFTEKEDKISGAIPEIGTRNKHSWRAGVSYDLSTALKWAKF